MLDSPPRFQRNTLNGIVMYVNRKLPLKYAIETDFPAIRSSRDIRAYRLAPLLFPVAFSMQWRTKAYKTRVSGTANNYGNIAYLKIIG